MLKHKVIVSSIGCWEVLLTPHMLGWVRNALMCAFRWNNQPCHFPANLFPCCIKAYTKGLSIEETMD